MTARPRLPRSRKRVDRPDERAIAVSNCQHCGQATRGLNDTLCADCWSRVPLNARQRFVVCWHTAFKYALPPAYLLDMQRIFIASMEKFAAPKSAPRNGARCHPNRSANGSGLCDECLDVETAIEHARASAVLRVLNAQDPSFCAAEASPADDVDSIVIARVVPLVIAPPPVKTAA